MKFEFQNPTQPASKIQVEGARYPEKLEQLTGR